MVKMSCDLFSFFGRGAESDRNRNRERERERERDGKREKEAKRLGKRACKKFSKKKEKKIQGWKIRGDLSQGGGEKAHTARVGG